MIITMICFFLYFLIALDDLINHEGYPILFLILVFLLGGWKFFAISFFSLFLPESEFIGNIDILLLVWFIFNETTGFFFLLPIVATLFSTKGIIPVFCCAFITKIILFFIT